LGPIVETDTILRFGDRRAYADYLNREDPIKDQLMNLSRIVVQDRWQHEIGLENAAGRADSNLRAHFADFSAYLLPLLENYKQDSYIPLCSTWCDVCEHFIAEQRKPKSNLPKIYSCQICEDGDFDLCTNCYDSGKRCKVQTHVLQSTMPPSI
jgi:hypothetical protein